jgi:hypothetical protein
MTQELRRREKHPVTKVKEPDTFDGSDPRKLNNFILLCNLYFRQNPAYSDNSAKVNFALSHLRGLALDRECHGLPWGFPGQPAPVPVETRARSHGHGF